MSSFNIFIASHPGQANTLLGGEAILYTPQVGPAFTITGIVDFGYNTEQSRPEYAATVRNVMETSFASIPISGDTMTIRAKNYVVQLVGNKSYDGTRTFYLREARS